MSFASFYLLSEAVPETISSRIDNTFVDVGHDTGLADSVLLFR